MSNEDDRRSDLFDQLDHEAKFKWLFNDIARLNEERKRIMAGVYWALGGIATLIMPNIPAWLRGWLK